MERAEKFASRSGEIPDFSKFPGAVSLRKILDGDKWIWRATYSCDSRPGEKAGDFVLRMRKDLLARQLR